MKNESTRKDLIVCNISQPIRKCSMSPKLILRMCDGLRVGILSRLRRVASTTV